MSVCVDGVSIFEKLPGEIRQSFVVVVSRRRVVVVVVAKLHTFLNKIIKSHLIQRCPRCEIVTNGWVVVLVMYVLCYSYLVPRHNKLPHPTHTSLRTCIQRAAQLNNDDQDSYLQEGDLVGVTKMLISDQLSV